MLLSSSNVIEPQGSRILLIADLHLQPGEQVSTARFIDFLHHTCKPNDALFILGDLFDAWIGPELIADFAPLIKAFSATVARGVTIGFLAGNRDFLLAEPFFQQTGVVPLPPITSLLFGDVRYVLLHGDQFCLKDPDYRLLYETTRNPEWQADILRHPRAERDAWVAKLRQNMGPQLLSSEAYRQQMVTSAHLLALGDEHQADTIIYGHFHSEHYSQITTATGKLLTNRCLPEWEATSDSLILSL